MRTLKAVSEKALATRTDKSAPSDWNEFSIRDVTLRSEHRDPRLKPTVSFRYVDVSSVSNTSFKILGATEMLGRVAPSRARKEIHTNDV